MSYVTAQASNNTLDLKKEPSFSLFDSSVYLNCLKVYYAYYGVIPSYKTVSGVDHNRAVKWIEQESGLNIFRKHIKEYYSHEKVRMECENVLYLVGDSLLVDIEDNGVVCVVYQTNGEKNAQEIVNRLKRFKRKRTTNSRIHIITNGNHGLELASVKCPKPTLSIDKHYNDDLKKSHKDMLRSLSSDNSGLYLFHGTPGTGKSTYIRYLINNVRKQFIFLSPKIAGNLDTPSFASLLIENKNSVLVIEDAEDILVSRERENNSAISLLLNLTDGILGESLGIQTICTFNTKLENIDEALLRKGRLMGMYEFGPLVPEKTRALLLERGVPVMETKAMTLADIYNAEKSDYMIKKPKTQIGFKVA